MCPFLFHIGCLFEAMRDTPLPYPRLVSLQPQVPGFRHPNVPNALSTMEHAQAVGDWLSFAIGERKRVAVCPLHDALFQPSPVAQLPMFFTLAGAVAIDRYHCLSAAVKWVFLMYPSPSKWAWTLNRVPRKTSFASFSRYPAGFVYWGRGLTINGLRYSGTCPFPQTPIPLRFFDVP